MKDKFNEKIARIAAIGLEYVGLTLVWLFSTKFPTVGYGMNQACVDGLIART